MEYMEYNEKKNLIKIIKKIVLVIVIGILLNSYLTSPSKAYKALDSHFKKTYGEEFVIKGIGRRRLKDREWYEAGIVFPKSYIGTPKENDRYYWGRGFAEIEAFGFDVGDSYGGVLLNESANEFYGKKLKELFGENVLPVLEIDGEYKYTDFVREYSRVSKRISGGIYIFGRVESDEDKEWYRKQIYEFVQFMKETGTFEYVDLAFYISDERLLSDEFQNNESLQNTLRKLGERVAVKERKEILSKVDESYKNTSLESRQKYLENMNKSDIRNEIYVNFWLYTKIYSKKYIESNSLDSEKKEYDKLEDIEFSIADY